MDILPVEFQALEGKIAFIRRISDNEYHSSCPNCGTEGHVTNDDPNRFVMWIMSRNGLPFGLCRKCGYKWSARKQDTSWTQEEREEFSRKVRQLEADYFSRKSVELAELSARIKSQGLYRKYYEEGQKIKSVVEYYEKRGIPAGDWQNYLQVGYMMFYKVRGVNSVYDNRAYTHPIWTPGGEIENIKLRIGDPNDANDRYRNLYKSGCQHLYAPVRGEGIKNKVVLLEGEFKADVAQIRGGLPDEYQVLGVQSSEPENRVLQMLEKSEVIYLAFDPDAYMPSSKTGRISVVSVARKLGEKRVRYVVPPDMKFDDAILCGYQFRNAVNMAVKAL